MKKYFTLLTLTILFLIAALPVQAQDAAPAQKLQNTVKQITEYCKKEYRLLSQTALPLTGSVAPAPVTACRLIYSGKPLKELRKENNALADIPEFTDIVLIPTNSEFRLDKAIAQSTATSAPETRDFFFQQYGIEWRRLKSNLTYYTLYLGRNEDFYCFANGNLLFLLQLQAVLNLKDGFSPIEYLAKALGDNSVDAVTADSAVLLLPAYGDRAIPAIEEEIEETLALDDDISRHIEVLFRIGSTAALKKINSYAETADDDAVLQPIFDVILRNKVEDADLKICYQRMLERQVGVKEIIALYKKMKWDAELRKACALIAAKPKSFMNYRDAIIILDQVDDETVKKYDKIEEDIRQQLLRGGDMPRSTSYHIAGEADSTREARLKEEDKKRTHPLIALLLYGPKPRMAILSGMSLALMDDTRAPYTVKKYVGRVRNAGVELLQAVPKKAYPEIQSTIEALLRYGTSEREKTLLQDVARRINTGR